MKEKVRFGLIGFGARGSDLLRDVLLPMAKDEGVELCCVCDLYEDRATAAADKIEEATGVRPLCTTDYKEVIDKTDADAIIIMCAWEYHIPIAIDAMKAGKYVGMEVGGAYSIDDCWRLVNTSEETGMPCMILENCCYGNRELMVLSMVKRGLFGEISACEGGYCHDLRHEVSYGEENRHYRLRNYTHRNCDNYPTHELGPICKVLNINNGNRMLSLTSTASCARGLHPYIVENRGADDKLANVEFCQGDVIKTVIRCYNGELITLTLDTTLPRAYSRRFTVRGTKASYWEDTDALFVDGKDNEKEWRPHEMWGTAAQYEKENAHPLWQNYEAHGGHGGMDYLVFSAFLEAVRAGTQTPIDVYDAASWMAITALSEQSIALGSAPQYIPDFTRGKWMNRTDMPDLRFRLDKLPE